MRLESFTYLDEARNSSTSSVEFIRPRLILKGNEWKKEHVVSIQNSENISFLPNWYTILFEFLQGNEMNSKLGRLNKWIEPYGSNSEERKNNEFIFII